MAKLQYVVSSNTLQRVQVDTGVEQGLGQLYISRNRSSIVIHGMGHFHHHFRRKISLQLSTESIDLSRYLKCNGKFMTDLKIHKELFEMWTAERFADDCNTCKDIG